MPLSPGARLGPYEIIAQIGAGGMGEVYRATDTRLDRTVAVKVLPAHMVDQPGARQRLEREARAVFALNHPNISMLHDIGAQDGVHYLVLEYLDGQKFFVLELPMSMSIQPLHVILNWPVALAR